MVQEPVSTEGQLSALITIAAGVAAAALGLSVLFASVIAIHGLQKLQTMDITLRAVFAGGFIASGLALLTLRRASGSEVSRTAAFIAAAGVVFIGLIVLIEFYRGVDGASFSVALAFVLSGGALMSLDRQTSGGWWPAQVLAMGLALLAFLALLGHVYSVDPSRTIGPYASMPLPATLAFLALALGILISRPRRGIVELFASSDAGGIMVRRLLPVAVLMPPTIGWLRWSGERAGLYPTSFGTALAASVSVLVFLGLILSIAYALNRSDKRRRLAEQALRESEERMRGVVEHMAEGLIVANMQGRLLHWNRAALELHGFADSKTWRRGMEEFVDIFEMSTLEGTVVNFAQWPMQRLLRGERVRDCELRIRRLDKAWERVFSYSGAVVNEQQGRPLVFLTIADVTARMRAEGERQQLEAQLRQAHKMEAIGQLSGGIAHDFNNILTAISGNAKLAREDLPGTHPVQESLQQIEQASRRASEVVKRILAFSRQQAPERRPMKLDGLIKEAIGLWRASVPAMIEIRTQLKEGVPSISADATQVHQVLMNLVTNAMQAMSVQTHGRIDIQLDEVHVDDLLASAHPDLHVGNYVRLSIGDTGCGMDAATLERIFDPFFTTKAPGEGTGLGLSVVHGIMKNHDGAVTVYSRPGAGTTFRLYFPAAAVAATAENPSSVSSLRGQGQRILYVDDEEPLVFLASRMLRRLGYEVVGFTDPVKALNAMLTQPQDFDAVVSDCSMPRMTGFELAAEVLKAKRDLPVILTSGYVRTEEAEAAIRMGVKAVLLKPNTVEQLGGVLHQVFAGGSVVDPTTTSSSEESGPRTGP